MKLDNSKLRVLKSLGILIGMFGTLSFYGFNCAPPSFQVMDQSSLSVSNTGDIIPSGGGVDLKPTLPQALLTAEQVYQSMLNLTEQTTTITGNQVGEFTRREGAFSESSEVNLVNSPMLIAMTSFAGEVCNGLVAREQGQTAAMRKYFQSVNFTGPIANLTADNYSDVVTRMANGFWGRAPSSDELTLFNTFRSDFTAAIPAAQIAQNAQTRALVLSTCTAMLGSFDVFTY